MNAVAAPTRTAVRPASHAARGEHGHPEHEPDRRRDPRAPGATTFCTPYRRFGRGRRERDRRLVGELPLRRRRRTARSSPARPSPPSRRRAAGGPSRSRSRSTRARCGARTSGSSPAGTPASRASLRGSGRTRRGRCRGSRSRRRGRSAALAATTASRRGVELAAQHEHDERARRARSRARAPRRSPRRRSSRARRSPSRRAASARPSRSRGTAIATIPTSSAAPESAAKSAEERNDAWRRPTVPARKISAPKNCASPTIVASALHTASDQSGSTRSRVRRISSGSAGASSAYSANFAAVTPCVCQAYAAECERP